MNNCQWRFGLLLAALAFLSGPGHSQENPQPQEQGEVSRSTPDTIALPPLEEGQLGESALQGLPEEAFTEGDFVEIQVEPVFFSEEFSGPQPQHLIRYQQLQLLLQDQERRQRLEPGPQVPHIHFRQDGRQAAPEHQLRTQPQ